MPGSGTEATLWCKKRAAAVSQPPPGGPGKGQAREVVPHDRATRQPGRSSGTRVTAHDDRPVAGIPLLPRSYIPRVRLWDRLNVATEGSVTMVIAPAGAGKTLGVAGRMRRTGRAADAWWVGSTSDLSVEDLRTLTEIPSYGARPTLLILDDAHTLSRQVLRYLDDRLSQDPQTLRVVLLSRWDLALTAWSPSSSETSQSCAGTCCDSTSGR